MLFEVLVRRGQDQSGKPLPGLYPGQPKWTTDRRTAKRVLEAIARARITLSWIKQGKQRCCHLDSLPDLVKRVLH
jgi:hypothetical protein